MTVPYVDSTRWQCQDFIYCNINESCLPTLRGPIFVSIMICYSEHINAWGTRVWSDGIVSREATPIWVLSLFPDFPNPSTCSDALVHNNAPIQSLKTPEPHWNTLPLTPFLDDGSNFDCDAQVDDNAPSRQNHSCWSHPSLSMPPLATLPFLIIAPTLMTVPFKDSTFQQQHYLMTALFDDGALSPSTSVPPLSATTPFDDWATFKDDASFKYNLLQLQHSIWRHCPLWW